jgi:glycosyltransferase 2 family protein
MKRKLLAWGRLVGPPVVLGVLVLRLGTGPFLAGLRSVNGEALAGAAGLAVLTTVAYAWRWKLVASGLGADLPLSAAIAAYYRALFLNATLPGGIVGDVHRGVSHGRDVQDVGLALRAVAWERFAGQVVQLLLTVVVLLVLPSPVHTSMPWVVAALGPAAVGVLLLGRRRLRSARSRWSRLRRAAADDIRAGLLARRAWPGIALASALGLGGHAATFLIAARTVGVTAPSSRLLPIALLVIAAMTLPSIGGWGPREGMAAWVFGAAGLGAQRGVAAAVVYGVMILVATLPGAVVLVVAWFRRNPPPQPAEPTLREGAARA